MGLLAVMVQALLDSQWIALHYMKYFRVAAYKTFRGLLYAKKKSRGSTGYKVYQAPRRSHAHSLLKLGTGRYKYKLVSVDVSHIFQQTNAMNNTDYIACFKVSQD